MEKQNDPEVLNRYKGEGEAQGRLLGKHVGEHTCIKIADGFQVS